MCLGKGTGAVDWHGLTHKPVYPLPLAHCFSPSLQESKLKDLVTRYSEFMNFPIYIQVSGYRSRIGSQCII